MSVDRLIDLFALLLRNSALADLGVRAELGNLEVLLLNDNGLVATWTHDGERFKLSHGCPATPPTFAETVTQAVHLTVPAVVRRLAN